MSEENPQPNPVLAWAQDHQVPSIFIGLGIIVILGLLLSAVLGEDSEEVVVEITMPSDSAPTTAGLDARSDDPDRPEVPQVDCQTLLTDDEIDEALFGPDPSGPHGHFTFSQGETCLYEPMDESGHYIKIEPGHPSDFDPDPRPLAVEGVGEAALWFDNGIDMGALSVGVNVPDASLIYRIHIGRPDLTGEQRLAQATELALLALPRFPGTPPGPPEPLVDFCEMIPDVQAEAILSEHRDASPSTQDEILVRDRSFGLASHDLSEEGDASCRKLILSEIYIEAQHGSLTDFEDGARMEGVSAEPVEGLGDEAVWFPNVPYHGSFTAPHERGVLAVRVGEAMFRIVIAVPDTPSDDQLQIARRLAAGAIALIPGVDAPELEPEVVTFDEEPPDLPPQSLYDVVYEGVGAGDWTEGEGLIAALEWMLAGESEFIEDELPDPSGTTVVRAAQAYISSGSPGASDIQQLLDEMMLTAEELEENSVPAETAAAGLLVSAAPVAAEFIGCPGGEDTCHIEVPLNEFDDIDQEKFRAFVLLPSEWGFEGLDSPAIDAFRDAVVTFEALADGMPPTGLFLNIGSVSFAHYNPGAGNCMVSIDEGWAGNSTDDLFHTVAEETAHCFISFNLAPQLMGNPQPWLEEGLAEYLAGVVYPEKNVEHKALPGLLAQEELWTTMPQRKSTNWIYWEYLDQFGNPAGIMQSLRLLPEGGDLAANLAAYPGVSERFHGMGQALSDSSMPDIGGGNVPYGPKSWQVILASPKKFDGELSMFATERYRLEVPSGRYACEVTVTADGAELSWRTGMPGVPGSWSEDVPDTLEGTSVLLVTSVEEGASFSFEASKTGDNPDCEEEDEEAGDPIEPILDLCRLICDPSSYFWAPREF